VKNICKNIFTCSLFFLFAACNETTIYAPVSDINVADSTADHRFEHVAQKNDKQNNSSLSLSFSSQQSIAIKTRSKWMWPAKGKITNTFSASQPGINIIGKKGDAIFAAAEGKVVYCGDGLRGYGNLIILKHYSSYLSAYAHPSKVFVKEGEFVRQGQKIAEMDETGIGRNRLYFEIRYAGKPINPLSLLDGKL
jgi:lipoprotein NlpD